MVGPKLKLEPDTQLKWLGKDLRFGVESIERVHQPAASIGNTEGARRIGLAKWLVLAMGDCTRKKLKSALGKLVWLARLHVGWAPLVSGVYAHMLWGPHYLSRTPLALLRSLAPLFFCQTPF